MDFQAELKQKGERAKIAARKLATVSAAAKNQALQAIADALLSNTAAILAANVLDMEAAKGRNIPGPLLDRLKLDEARIKAMAEGLRQVAFLPDPIGEVLSGGKRPNGLLIQKVRVPLGVVGMIYEARPNVTVDAAGLCLKSGNATILRGGSEAIQSNTAIVQVIADAARQADMPADVVQLIATTDREAVNAMLKLNEYIDVIIPRGGAGLIKTVVHNSTVPVIETGTGVCHTFVDVSADLQMAQTIAFNAKVSRPAVCNAMETLLVHAKAADQFLPPMLEQFHQAGVELRGCPVTQRHHRAVKPATQADWATEYSDYILSVKVVSGLEEALEHIAKYSTKHSEAIVTSDYGNALRFQQEVDAACVYVNASTRFSDGFEFGLGAEIGISTQKLHARGPMGLTALTSFKYMISGQGQIR
ncbi:glutamate-5-semialdehyde dehydrogenase [Acetonema longum]|uniref:Gamma-glutamyl phosphate reductase n=1 Tax=Acetonema longum DSM 6540 TaxID=1009370 RepID=F7NHR3_9FIRM|nr:glutamate-5-semialdehyde dehydrogenase [Acetonema longum]EGO64438.1 gamma-glutamyl phosphate reductase [Acetonema longum DSM 6540]